METIRYEFKKLTKSDFVKMLCDILGYEKREITHYEDGSKALIEFKKKRGCHRYVLDCALGRFTGHLFLGEFYITHGYFCSEQTRTRVNTSTLISLGYLVEVA
ncbi:MAG: hypothetical protein IJO91_08475 [Oscillospiraceae bacterium]|nr:hypothetical protein [Oscillospiraceae bacterium]